MTPSDPFATIRERDILNKVERLVRKGERDSRLLDGRDFRMRPYAEAYRLLDMWRDNLDGREPE